MLRTGQAALLESVFKEMRHPPYSRELALCDYQLNLNLKKHLCGQIPPSLKYTSSEQWWLS